MQNRTRKEIKIDLTNLVIANKSKINENGKGEIGKVGKEKQEQEMGI